MKVYPSINFLIGFFIDITVSVLVGVYFNWAVGLAIFWFKALPARVYQLNLLIKKNKKVNISDPLNL